MVRVIFTSFVIELKRTIRYPLNLIFTIMASLLSLFPLLFINRVFNSDNYIWILSGGLMWMFITQSLWIIGTLLKNEARAGTLEQIFVSPMNILIVLVGKSLVTLIINLTTLFFGIIFIAMLFNISPNIGYISILILVSTPIIYMLSFNISLLIYNISEPFAMLQILQVFLMIISGVMIPVKFLFPIGHSLLQVLPLAQIITLFRLSIQGGFNIHMFLGLCLNLVIILIFSLVITKNFFEKMSNNGRYNGE